MKKFTIIKVVLIIVVIININKNYLPFFMKKYMFIFITLIAFGCTIENIDPNEKKVNSLIAKIIDSNNLPGLSVSVMKNDEIVYSKGFGYADIENKTQIIPSSTKFRIGSFSKTLTASALMKLVEKNKLNLDESIHTYIPEFPKKNWNFNLRQMGGHLSGIRHYKGNEFYINKNYENVIDALDIFKDDPLLHEPGTKYYYSTHAWTLISAAIEKASETPFLEYMYKNVFEPLGMINTYAETIDLNIKDKVTYYKKDNSGNIKIEREVNNSWKWAGGGFISTTEDIANFLHNHSKSGYLTDESLNILMSPQTTTSAGTTNYGIGWRKRYGNNNEVLYGHTGGSVGGTTYAFIAMDYNVIVVITSNLSDASFGDLPNDIFEIYN